MKAILYHGTSPDNADRIMRDGFKDRSRSGVSNWEGKVRSLKDHIYLTRAYPFYFASCATKKGDTASVIKVEVDVDDLYPDEDFLKYAGIPEKEYRINIDGYRHVAMLSLKKLDNASIRAGAPIKVLGRKDFSLKQMFWHSDPTITLMNSSILGDYYRRLTDAWWNGDPNWEETERFAGEKKMIDDLKLKDGEKVHPLIRTRIAEIKAEKDI